MKFPEPLHQASLIKRYKRFLADVIPEGEGQEQMTLHCPNTGAMTGCAEPGFHVAYSLSDNPKRKYPGTWELARNTTEDWIVVNTQRANQVVAEALADERIPELAGYRNVRPEVKYGEGSRVDFLLEGHSERPDCYLEVKSVTLCEENGQGYFPDAVTQRGQKHIDELVGSIQAGHEAVLLFCVMHTGITSVAAASHIDKVYAQKFDEAIDAGLTVLVYTCDISLEAIDLVRPLPFERA